jgi:hypothetical protein
MLEGVNLLNESQLSWVVSAVCVEILWFTRKTKTAKISLPRFIHTIVKEWRMKDALNRTQKNQSILMNKWNFLFYKDSSYSYQTIHPNNAHSTINYRVIQIDWTNDDFWNQVYGDKNVEFQFQLSTFATWNSLFQNVLLSKVSLKIKALDKLI